MEYYFVERAKMDSIFELQNTDIDDLFDYFMSGKGKTAYIEDCGKIYGIVSIGDMIRGFNASVESLELLVNTEFRYASTLNLKGGGVNPEILFADEERRIRELPVLQNDRLVGGVCLKEENESPWLYRELMQSRLSVIRKQVFWKQMTHFLKSCDVMVFHFDIRAERTWELLKKDEYFEQTIKRREGKTRREILEDMSEYEQKEFFGEFYRDSYVEEMVSEFEKLKVKTSNGFCFIEDIDGRIFNFVNGHRVTVGQPRKAHRKIFVFGPCIAMGACVEDSATICSYLQEALLQRGFYNYKVENCGIGLGVPAWMDCIFKESYSAGDVVIILDNETKWDEKEKLEWIGNYKYRGRGILDGIYESLGNPLKYMLDWPLHCNHIVNAEIAKKVLQDIQPFLLNDNHARRNETPFTKYLITGDMKFYFRQYFRKYKLSRIEGKKTGAIVMNCNPFTKGHRYLIEIARGKVDLLYIFVVEEDKSYFSFSDRLEMVKRGTADMDGVRVVPSGNYIASEETFSQYFKKESVEIIEEMDYDIYIFGKVVARELGIQYRFVGEEPFDKVTRKYNETMKKLLPKFNVKLIEIPRVTNDLGEPVSAAKVRGLLRDGKEDALKDLLPDSTLAYLKKRWKNSNSVM